MTYIRRELYIVNDLRINLLLDIDTMISKSIILNYFKKQLSIISCEDFIIEININFINL